MTLERTVVFVKPEGMKHFSEIRQRLASVGKITFARRVHLTRDALFAIHHDKDLCIREAVMRHLNGLQLPVLVLEGEGIIDKVVEEVGSFRDPLRCKASSIRAMFAEPPCEERIAGNLFYYHNLVHRPRDSWEANRHINILTSSSLVSFAL